MATKQKHITASKIVQKLCLIPPRYNKSYPSIEDKSFNQNYEYYWIYNLLMNAKKVCLIFNKELQAKGNSHSHLLLE